MTKEDMKLVERDLASIFSDIGMDRPSNFSQILEYVINDVVEAADPINWTPGDVVIALRRWIEEQTEEDKDEY